MAEDFDPYRKWLGIPEKDQPPHHYRLLNIEPFESDPEVISNAVDARMAQVKQYQSGKHSEASQRLLNELATAKVCLLNAERKAEYDEDLSAQLRPHQQPDAAAIPMATPLPAAQGARAEQIPTFESPSVAQHVSDDSERKKKQQTTLVIAGIAGALVILIGLGSLQFLRSRKPAKQPGPTADRSSPSPAGSGGGAVDHRGSGGTSPISIKPKAKDVLSAIVGNEKPRLLGDLVNGDDPPGTGGGGFPSEGAQHGLVGEYFGDRTFTGKVFERVDPQIQFDFDESPPDPPMPEDYFSIRWTGWLVAPETGDYQLSTMTDDGVRVWVDGEKVVEEWRPGPPRRSEGSVRLTEGPHAIKIEYFEVNLTAVMRLNWSRPGVFEEQPIPTTALLVAKPSAPPPERVVSSDPPPMVEPPLSEPPLSEPPISEPPISEPPVSKPPVSEPPVAEPPRPTRHPIPSRAARGKIKKDIQEIFGDEFESAKTPAKKIALAKLLLSQAQDSTDEPDSRFVLLSEASDLLARGGDVSNAIQIVDVMQRQYDIKPLTVKVFLLKTAVDSMPSGSSGLAVGQRIADQAMVLANDYLGRDDYDTARNLTDLAMTAARKAKDASLIQPLTTRQREINRKKVRFASIKSAKEKLAADPDDPEANLTVGRWDCFNRDDWAEGLKHLAKGSDLELVEIARKEISKPTDPALQVAVADGWYKQVDKEKDAVKKAVRRRAKFWYSQARPSVEGLDKVKVNKRLESIAKAEAAETAGPKPKVAREPVTGRGVVQPGNVALASNGTTVTGVYSGASYLLDGKTSGGSAVGKHPCEWTITFDKVYRLKGIAIKLRDTPSSRYYYNYAVAVSADGKKYFPLVDRRQGQWRGWQPISIRSRPVKSIKFYGLGYNYTSRFYVDEFQAYCVLPKR